MSADEPLPLSADEPFPPSRRELVQLDPHEVHVWSFSLGDPPRGQRREIARRGRAAILARYLGVPAEAVRIAHAPGGKPIMAPDGTGEGAELEFNLSHSGTHAVLAVARSLPVGIDLEAHRDSIDLQKGIRDRCTAREGDWVLASADPHGEWVRLWARKEAVVKATGEGVLDQLGRIDVLGEHVTGVEDEPSGRWRCVDLRPPGPGFHLALAFPDLSDVRVSQLTLDELPC